MNQTIALVDDDKNITTSVSMALEAEGFSVIVYHDGEAGFRGISDHNPDIAVLDVKMPRMDGIELIQKLRQDHKTLPIIFLTSKDDEIDEVIGLRMGADDYITKPFSQRLLIERIKTLLRRQSFAEGGDSTSGDEDSLIKRGPLTLDEDRHVCTWNGTNVVLTVTEYLLMKSLTEKPGHVRSREQLIDVAYGQSTYVDDRMIDSHIKRIRKKFKDIDPNFNQIETIYGVGYKYENPA